MLKFIDENNLFDAYRELKVYMEKIKNFKQARLVFIFINREFNWYSITNTD